MTIKLASAGDILDWPEFGITMTREQAERLGADGYPLPHGEPCVYAEGEPIPSAVGVTPYSVLVQRIEFMQRRPVPKGTPDLECSE